MISLIFLVILFPTCVVSSPDFENFPVASDAWNTETTYKELPKDSTFYSNPEEAAKFAKVEKKRQLLEDRKFSNFEQVRSAMEKTHAPDAVIFQNNKLLAVGIQEFTETFWKIIGTSQRFTVYHHLEDEGEHIVERMEYVRDKDNVLTTVQAKRYWKQIDNEYKIVMIVVKKIEAEERVHVPLRTRLG